MLVASSRAKLDANNGNLWDSGKVTNDKTYGILYAGAPLDPHQPCYWKVMAWDGNDRPGAWSDASYWTMGFLDPNEWPGEWIGYDAERQSNSSPPVIALHKAQWVRSPADRVPEPPAGRRVFLGVWELPSDVDLRSAMLAVCADDTAKVEINGTEVIDKAARRQ